jgi:putative ABC transport system permease protein
LFADPPCRAKTLGGGGCARCCWVLPSRWRSGSAWRAGAGRELSEGIAASFSRMGADLVVVPRNTLVNLTASLLTVQPTDETLDSAIVRSSRPSRAWRGRAAASGSGRCRRPGFNLIAFDPAADFTVQTWAREQRPGPIGVQPAAGRRPRARPDGRDLSVAGGRWRSTAGWRRPASDRLDESYFISFAVSIFLARCAARRPSCAGRPFAMCLPDYRRAG